MALKFSELGARQKGSDIAKIMTLTLERPDILSLAAGFTDTESLPMSEVSKLVDMLAKEGDKSVLQYGSNQGRPDLRKSLTQRLSKQDGVSDNSYSEEDAFITNGSQQALYLAVQTLCDPGDVILVEQPTYFVFLEMLRGLGVKTVSMPMKADGNVDTNGLQELLKQYEASGNIERVKAVYTVSYFANPTGHSISYECKEGVVSVLSQYNGSIALIDDSAYRELYYESPFESRSVLSAASEANVPVLYSTTLTKPFASGLKVGYGLCSDSNWLARMLSTKGQQDFGTAHLNQAIMAKVFETGLFDSHLSKIRKSYFQKMDTLDSILREEMGDSAWSWDRPDGGLYLWLKAPDGMRTDFDSEFHAKCLDAGVMYVPGDLCFANHSDQNHIRLSFGVLALDDLKSAGMRFARATS